RVLRRVCLPAVSAGNDRQPRRRYLADAAHSHRRSRSPVAPACAVAAGQHQPTGACVGARHEDRRNMVAAASRTRPALSDHRSVERRANHRSQAGWRAGQDQPSALRAATQEAGARCAGASRRPAQIVARRLAVHPRAAVDGGPEREARLTPRVHIALGPYEMTVEPPPPGCDLALAIELVRPLPDDLAAIRAKSRTSLEATVLSKRGPAWMLAIILGLVF